MPTKISWKLTLSFLVVISLSLLIFYLHLTPVSIVLLLSLIGLIIFLLSRYLTQSLERMVLVSEKIAKGDFTQRIVASSTDELGALGRAINEMVQNLQEQFSQIEHEKNQLMTILDGMVEGVLVTNKNQEILLINPAFHLLLNLEENCVGRTVLECTRNQYIHNAIEMMLQNGRPYEEEISVMTDQGETYFILHTAPLRNEKEIMGSISVFYDVTRLRKLENMRREFVANVSHELKTPLTNIRGYAETLLQGALQDTEAAHRFTKKIENNALQLQNLVEDILKLSEIESGRLELNLIPTSLKTFIQNLYNDYEELLKAKGIYFKTEIKEPLAIPVDLSALKHILGNLIDNAIKYTPPEGTITLSAVEEGSFCKITVADTGTGISERDLPHVFERFYRADKARSRQMGSTGLGLAIVKHLVQAHKGEVGVMSELSKGSRFFFTLPLKNGDKL